jgi:hypothetical protein
MGKAKEPAINTAGRQDDPDLDEMMQAGRKVFDGALDEDAGKIKTPPVVEPTGPDEKRPEHPGEEESATQTADKAEMDEGAHAEEKIGKAKPLRFTSHEAAEEGYRNLQGKATKAEQDAARLRKELEDLKTAKVRQEELEHREQEYVTYAETKYQEALVQIDELDPDADDYNLQVAKIWAKRDGDIRRYEWEKGIGTAAQKPKETDAKPKEPGSVPSEEEAKAARSYVAEKAVEAGINPEDPGWQFLCTQAPSEIDGRQLSFEEQVDWALEEKRTYDAYRSSAPLSKEEKEAEARKLSEQRQSQELSLGRGASAQKRSETDAALRPMSLDDAIEAAKEERRL